MSFELAFWHERPTPSDDAALATYYRLTEEDGDAVRPHVAVSRFLTDLLTAFEDLTEENADSSPWAGPVCATDGCVMVSISGSRSVEVMPRLQQMASRHGLVTFDPQNSRVVSQLRTAHTPTDAEAFEGAPARHGPR
ncbi:hypothetical protein [Cellulomonas telluris]|uniref:hypothetical protein n=1 Tax=Cellulomonas telluris TaxID=2306636 RepID=UPI0010A8B4CE|nr:hypothetical protein [Cellulomonas telluris]